MPLPTIAWKPEIDIARAIQTGGGGTEGTNLFACAEIPADPGGAVPLVATFVQVVGGLPEKLMMGRRRQVRVPLVQVMNRSGRSEDAHATGLNVARQLRALLARATVTCLANSQTYRAIIPQGSEVAIWGVDDGEVHRFSTTFECWLDEDLT